ncbi:hypothetical protein L3081_11130 [Colwellia sp. MSW7]|uniref:Uncharacterized protein n=1 Tax=Colwellia maritima TaxID=2912588 RepID=A0ABS9X0V5_9GAMM|nr:hypothetical protein [Colwellia maritima]MCI2283849.1 hypothetical protein [Colwellia maritima]
MKTVLSTIFVIFMAGFIAAKFFFSSILALFGYTALPIESLAKLTHSQKVVQKMQKRHKSKSANVSKRFIKRSGKKVAITAASAATIGTVAVIGTLTYLEVSQYCDEQRELSEDANLLFDTNTTFDMKACLVQGKQDSAQFANEAWQGVKDSSSVVLDDVLKSIEKSR